MNTDTATRSRALELLSIGVPPSQVASAIGVDPSRISQLMAEEEFSTELSTRKMENLTAVTARDAKYDSLEDKLVARLEQTIPMIMKPGEILRSLQIVNGLKRRGAPASPTMEGEKTQTIVNLVLPAAIQSRFVVDTRNQVIEAGEQTLVTIQSQNVSTLAQKHMESLSHGTKKDVPNLSAPVTQGTFAIEKQDEFGFISSEKL